MQPTEPQKEQQNKKDDQYAEALAKMAALDYQMEQKTETPQKRFKT